jgi:hypothetical protein
MSLKRLIAAAVVAGTLFAVTATDADGAVARRAAASARPMESVSLNRAMIRPKLNLRMVFQLIVASRNGHAGWIEVLSRGQHFPEVVIVTR